MQSLYDEILNYYTGRKLTMPDFDNAMKFAMTEIAEVYELDLARTGGWVRNNPESKPKYNKIDMAEELGDAIMMLVVAGIAEGVNPLEALSNKMDRKLKQQLKLSTGTSQLVPVSQWIEEIKKEVYK